MDIRKLVKKEVAGLKAYSAKEIPCRIKLDANESPYGFADAAKCIAGVKTNRYPDPEAKALRRFIAKDLGVKPENILFGNGSDELIYYLITTFGGPVAYPVPTFTMYGIIGQALGVKKKEIPLDKDFDIDIDKFLFVVKKEKPKLIFLSSPNNPTGNCFSTDRILKIIEASKGIVVVDEAYQPFSSENGMLPLLKDYKNLIIMRTLSKIGLAALRLGFIIAMPGLIEEVNKVRLPFNVNALSQAVAVAALKGKKEFRSSIKTIVAERERLLEAMETIEGITPFPTEANFILFRVDDPDQVYSALLKKGVLVRDIKSVVKGCLRVTVGTPEENAAFLRALRGVLRRTYGPLRGRDLI
ncbi:MAG: histidinol-phosphate transaminase [Nitrospiraceae bacterium]|jgi:histidinol-phosphate aminotransferase|nr:MAG: histidinol-phosphate transaminase [Nitrospiraceae bacterium]